MPPRPKLALTLDKKDGDEVAAPGKDAGFAGISTYAWVGTIFKNLVHLVAPAAVAEAAATVKPAGVYPKGESGAGSWLRWQRQWWRSSRAERRRLSRNVAGCYRQRSRSQHACAARGH